MREYETRTKVEAKEIVGMDHESDRTYFCNADISNKSTAIKIVMNFATATLTVTIDDKECITNRIDERLFAVEKAAISLLGYSTEQAKTSLSLNEVTISKLAIPLTTEKDHFTNDMYNLESAIVSHNPEYYNNTSISSLFLMNVSSEGKDRKGKKTTQRIRSSHQQKN